LDQRTGPETGPSTGPDQRTSGPAEPGQGNRTGPVTQTWSPEPGARISYPEGPEIPGGKGV